MTSVLYAVYLATGVFGLGITIIDLLGLIGDDANADSGRNFDSSDDSDGDAEGFDSDSVDALDSTDLDGDSINVDLDSIGNETDGDEGDAAEGLIVAQHIQSRGNVLLTIMKYLRNLIYFSMGFGPTGFAALLMRKSDLESLAWAVGMGIIILVGARLLRRVLKKELNSDITSADLLMESGRVIVSIGKGEMGKVRVKVGGYYVDRYALAKDSNEIIKIGTAVRVVDSDDMNIYVEKE